MADLFTVVLKTPYNEDSNGLSFSGHLIPATPEEIKAAHGKCGTCSYYGLLHTKPWNECLNYESPYFARHDGMIDKDKDYCRFYEEYCRNHHEPKE